jgi:hypothetical protein
MKTTAPVDNLSKCRPQTCTLLRVPPEPSRFETVQKSPTESRAREAIDHMAATVAPLFDASSLSVDPTLLVATTRKPVNGVRAKPWFGPERASAMIVARAKLVQRNRQSRFGHSKSDCCY